MRMLRTMMTCCAAVSLACCAAADALIYGNDAATATDASGNSVMIWEQSDWTNFTVDLYYTRYDTNTGYSTSAPVYASPTGRAYAPQCFVDNVGNVIGVWVATGPGGYDAIYAAVLPAGPAGSWSPPFLMSNSSDWVDPEFVLSHNADPLNLSNNFNIIYYSYNTSLLYSVNATSSNVAIFHTPPHALQYP